MGFVPDEFRYVVVFGETGCKFLFVLCDATDQIGGYANIEGSVAIACENVYVATFIHIECSVLDSCLRRNDGRQNVIIES